MKIESKTVNLVKELHYWSKTGIDIPRQIIELNKVI